MKYEKFYAAALSTLATRGEMTASQLCEAMNDRLGREVFDPEFYVKINRMVDDGWIEKFKTVDRPVTFYRITKNGQGKRVKLAANSGWSVPDGSPVPAPA